MIYYKEIDYHGEIAELLDGGGKVVDVIYLDELVKDYLREQQDRYRQI